MDKCRLKIWSLVLKVKQLRAEREREGTSSKETKRLDALQRTKRAAIQELLTEMYTWDCINSPATIDSVAYTQTEVDELFKGVLPWDKEGGTELAAAVVYHGRLYHSAKSDVDRTCEEEALVRVEKVRLIRWLVLCEKCIVTALGTGACEVGVGNMGEGSACAGARPTEEAGKVFLLKRWQRRVACL